MRGLIVTLLEIMKLVNQEAEVTLIIVEEGSVVMVYGMVTGRNGAIR